MQDFMTEKLPKDKMLMVAILISGGFITLLNQTVMSPALPSIMRDLHITAAVGQWLTSIFMLVNGLMVPITAWLINRFTTRQLFFSAMLIFILGTAVAAFSGDFYMLLAGRILQAVGAGIQLPFVSVMMMLIFPKERRGFAMGIVGVVMGFAPTIGPTFSGWIVDEFGWHYLFFAIAPLAIIDILFAFFLLRNIGEKNKTKLDVISAILSVIGFGSLLFGFSLAGNLGWLRIETLGLIILGIAAIILFVRRQLKRESPMLDLRTLKNSIFANSVILSMISSAGMTVGLVIMPIFLQNVLQLTALQSGLTLMPGALFMVGVSPISGIMFDKFGPRILCISGLSALTIGSGMLAFISDHTSVTYVLFAYTFRMIGIATVNMPITTWGLNALSNKKIAHGNAISNTGRQIAGSIGTAVLVTVMMMVSGSSSHTGAKAAALGIDIAFGCAAVLTAIALVIAIISVRQDKD
jgi:EmrB/QacA subfamily drug resistance transporter